MLPLNRRCFLQQSLAAGLIGGVHQATQPRARGRSALNQLRLAAIGVGNFGFHNLLNVAGEDVVAICDVDQRYLDQARQVFPRARAVHDYRKLFDDVRLDAVIISTPDHSHALPALLALRRGLHVYLEKPLAHRIADVRRLARAAESAGCVTQMGNQHHGSSGYQQAIAWLRSGALGRVSEIHAWTDRPIWPQGQPRPGESPAVPAHLDWDLWLGPAPARPYHPSYHPLGWRGWWDFGSGALGDRGPHLLDPIVAGLNLPHPSSVAVQSGGGASESFPQWSTVEWRFSGGDLHDLRLCWYDGGKQPPAELARARRLPSNGCLVIGEHARVFIPEHGGAPRWLGEAPAPARRAEGDLGELASHHEDWLAACKSGGPTRAPFAYGAKLTEICLLGNIALRLGRGFSWHADPMQSPDCPQAADHLATPARPGWALPPEN